jgi:hypothetical protein
MKSPTSPIRRRLSIPTIDANSTSAFIAQMMMMIQDCRNINGNGKDLLRCLRNYSAKAKTSCLLISQVNHILRKGRFKKEVTIIALCYLERFYRIIREADEHFAHPLPLFPIYCIMLSLALKQVTDFALSSAWWSKITGIKGFGRLEYSVWALLESKRAIFITPQQYTDWEKNVRSLALEFGSKSNERLLLNLNLYPIPNPNNAPLSLSTKHGIITPPSPPLEPTNFQTISGSNNSLLVPLL